MEPTKLSPELAHAIYFNKFILQLVQKFEPLQIFSFSKNSCITNEEGCFKNHTLSFNYNYCLLLVTVGTARIEYNVQDYANTRYQQGIITIICHNRASIVATIKLGHRFFKHIFTFGQLLYTNNCMLSMYPTLLFKPTNQSIKAQQQYKQHMPLAQGFLMCAAQCLQKAQYGICVFMLHQVVEQTCICLIRVHLDYHSTFHNLQRLLSLCTCFSTRPYRHWFSGQTEDERLFNLLTKSYAHARYKDGFAITAPDANALYQRTTAFLAQAKTMCLQIATPHNLLQQPNEIY